MDYCFVLFPVGMGIKTIAVDFDGVIHRYSKGWCDGTIYDVPNENSWITLSMLHDKYRIIIFTTRLSKYANGWWGAYKQKRMLNKWLKNWGFVKGKYYDDMTGEKPIAKFYIDDRAVKFRSWESLKLSDK